jgi:hypothetical protein
MAIIGIRDGNHEDLLRPEIAGFGLRSDGEEAKLRLA